MPHIKKTLTRKKWWQKIPVFLTEQNNNQRRSNKLNIIATLSYRHESESGIEAFITIKMIDNYSYCKAKNICLSRSKHYVDYPIVLISNIRNENIFSKTRKNTIIWFLKRNRKGKECAHIHALRIWIAVHIKYLYSNLGAIPFCHLIWSLLWKMLINDIRRLLKYQ